MRALGLLLWVLVGVAEAGPLVYTPINPSFGGNPLYGSTLLNEAQAQDQTKAPAKATDPDAAIKAFNSQLQSALLSRLSSSLIKNIADTDGKLHAGTVDTSSYTIDVKDLGEGQIQLTTTSKITGASQSFIFDQSQVDTGSTN